jgi:hypothetical protein
MLTRLYTPDMRIVHAVPFGEDFARLIAGADGGNVSVRQPAVPMVKPVVVPSLTRRIRVVLGLGADAKVGGIDARRVVANVHDDLVIGDWPNVKLIRVPMGANGLFAGKKKDAVTAMVVRSFPFPTAVAFLKALLKNIVRGKQRVFMQAVRSSSAVITSATQLATNGFFGPTLNAGKLGFGFVGHKNPPMTRSL